MKLSIVISILNSHEIVRRQILHFEKMGLPDDVEILFMDDSSDPPLNAIDTLLRLKVIPVNNPAPRKNGIFYDGRVSIARNLGAKLAEGEFLLMTDIDYIITEECIEAGRNMTADKQRFKREFGVILEDGKVTQDLDILRQYGLTEDRIKTRGLAIAPHPNNFIMRKSTFFAMGGYREDLQGEYPSRGDTFFKRDWTNFMEAGKATIADADSRPTILMFPNGQFCGNLDYNPFGLFHNLSRMTKNNPYYKTKETLCGQ